MGSTPCQPSPLLLQYYYITLKPTIFTYIAMNFQRISHRSPSTILRHAVLACTALWACQGAVAEGYNIAPEATVTATSQTKGAEARNVADGIIRIDGRGEWISDVKEHFWGEADYPSLRMEWPQEVTINKVTLYDRPAEASHTAGVTLRFSDGSRIGRCRFRRAALALAGRMEPLVQPHRCEGWHRQSTPQVLHRHVAHSARTP